MVEGRTVKNLQPRTEQEERVYSCSSSGPWLKKEGLERRAAQWRRRSSDSFRAWAGDSFVRRRQSTKVKYWKVSGGRRQRRDVGNALRMRGGWLVSPTDDGSRGAGTAQLLSRTAKWIWRLLRRLDGRQGNQCRCTAGEREGLPDCQRIPLTAQRPRCHPVPAGLVLGSAQGCPTTGLALPSSPFL